MTALSATRVSAGTTMDAADVNTPLTQIEAVVNGNIDATNFGAGKILAPSKLTQESATSNQVLSWNGTSWVPTTIGGASATILGYARYAPSAGSNPSTTSTSFVDIDATNLAVSFTAPSSGKVLVTFTAKVASSSASRIYNLRESTNNLSDTEYHINSNDQFAAPTTYHVVTGLTGGAAKTYKIGWKVASGTATLNIEDGDPTSPPAFIFVHALP